MKNYDHAAVGGIVAKEIKESECMAFNMENNYDARTFIAMLRANINKNAFSIRVRGSQSDRLSYREAGIHIGDQSVPLKFADRLRVYIEAVPSAAVTNAVEGLRRDFQMSLKKLKNREATIESLKDDKADQREIIEDLNSNLNASRSRNNGLVNDNKELAAELAEATEKLRKYTYANLKPEEVRLCQGYEGTAVVKMAKGMFEHTNQKLHTMKIFKEGTGLGLKDAKTVCDHLVWKDK